VDERAFASAGLAADANEDFDIAFARAQEVDSYGHRHSGCEGAVFKYACILIWVKSRFRS
jgi:hypothetical protein